MAKQMWEDEARDRFVTFLQASEGVSYRTAGENVLVGAKGGKDFDYLLEPVPCGGVPIALEIFRLTPDSHEMARDAVSGEIVNALRVELTKRGIAGYLIRTPTYFRLLGRNVLSSFESLRNVFQRRSEKILMCTSSNLRVT